MLCPRSIAALVTSVALSASCGGPGRDAAPPDGRLAAAGGRPIAPAAAESGRRTLVITVHDYAFTGVPERIPAGWLTVRMVNVGREVHMLATLGVPAGHTAREVVDALAHNRATPVPLDRGGPNAVSPGGTATATLFYPPGHYVLACVIESADGKLHSEKGMLAVLEVVPTTEIAADTAAVAAGEAAAGADALVTLTDYRVDVRGALRPGTRTVRVRNAATHGHELEILELLPGQSADDALRWFEHPAKEAPTARAVGGVVAIHPGQEALVTVTLRPGTYVFLCWVPDAAGRPHFRRGMRRTVSVAPTT